MLSKSGDVVARREQRNKVVGVSYLDRKDNAVCLLIVYQQVMIHVFLSGLTSKFEWHAHIICCIPTDFVLCDMYVFVRLTTHCYGLKFEQ